MRNNILLKVGAASKKKNLQWQCSKCDWFNMYEVDKCTNCSPSIFVNEVYLKKCDVCFETKHMNKFLRNRIKGEKRICKECFKRKKI
jgi:hypothetical protein